MCGICGVFNYANTSFEITEGLITRMRDTMVHRGPDDGGVYISPDRKIGLGHRRLSIIDLSSAGHQPMSNEDRSLWLIYNGEIYNHQWLRKGLQSKGHIYQSSTDTETILHLYEEKGIDCVRDFEGMFAFALWDSKKRRLFLVRDRIGEKPLYYTIQDGQLIFASEIKAILEHPQIERDIDTTALYHYLTFFVTPAPMTLFRGINKLPAGYIMQCDQQGSIRQQQYWDAIVPSPDKDRSEEYYIDTVRELLTSSIEKRMMSDVPFGVFLSGGIDSSTNVALMSQLMDRSVETFSVGFKDQPAYNELEYARQVARKFKTNHHEIIINDKDLIDYIPNLVHHQDEPIADYVCVPLYFISKLARDNGVIVIQIGEGSDEIFFGYDSYLSYLNIYRHYWKCYMKSPQFLRQIAYEFISSMLMNRWNIIKDGLRRAAFQDILRRAAANEELFWGGAIAFTEDQKRMLRHKANDSWYDLSSLNIVEAHLDKIDGQKSGADFLERMIYLELKQRLPELLLMRVDKITMSTSVEGRAPYLDHKLVEFAMGIPSKLKVKNGELKYILKKATEGIIPDNIIYRKKQGFSVPVKEWFIGKLGKYITNSILNSKLKERQLFNYEYIENLLNEQRKGKADNSVHLWLLFNLSKWYDYWIKGDE